MANSSDEDINNISDNPKDSGLDKSFVSKFMSGLINSTPLSKWFNKESHSAVRKREDEEEDELDVSYSFQPPSKRARRPPEGSFEAPVIVHTPHNNVSRVYERFPEPVAGPSGLHSRSLFQKYSTGSTNTVSSVSFGATEEANGGDSDSGESSGYVSAPKMAPVVENEVESEKSTPKVRSLFTHSRDTSPRSPFPSKYSPSANTSLSSRRPSFNASTFGSPNFVDRTLSTQQILKSPFYSGSTMYGGASAYGRRLTKHLHDDDKPKNSVQIKPVNEKLGAESTTLSKTARRILSTLEQYSTPISDVKKIPVVPKRTAGLLTPYLIRDRKRGSNKELQVPTVPDLIQMKQKQRLQNSTESVREMAKKSKSNLNRQEYKLKNEEEKTKICNKMKSSVGAVRQKVPSIEPVAEVKLPKVSLPITDLPKFDFVPMVPKETVPVPLKPKYSFSEPLVICKDSKAVPAINCFKFSEPLSKMIKKNGGIKLKNNGENILKGSQVRLVPIGKKLDQWECKTCWVRNDNGIEKCIACSTPRVVPKSFGGKFKPSNDTWECSSCLIRNKNDLSSCAACSTPKTKSTFGDKFKPNVVETWECTTCLIRNKNELSTCAACSTPKVPKLLEKLKPNVSDTWECTTCLIRNKKTLEKCEACETPRQKKTVTFSTTNTNIPFSVKKDWECQTCLIRNSNELVKCAACETPKIGATPKSEEWECPTCMVKNRLTIDTCVCCGERKPGSKGTTERPKSTLTFNFGIDKATALKYKFGISPPQDDVTTTSTTSTTDTSTVSTTTTSTPTFSFGIPPKVETTVEKTDPVVPPKSSTNFLLKPNEKLPEPVTPALPGFRFIPSTTVSTTTTSTIPTFEFKPPAINGDLDRSKSEVPKPIVSGTDTVSKPKEVSFGDGSKAQDSSFNKLSKSETFGGFGTTNKPSGTGFGIMNKPSETSFSVSKASSEVPVFGSTLKSIPAFSSTSTKTTDSQFGLSTKPSEVPFSLAVSKTNESPFGDTMTKPKDSFGSIGTPPTNSLFGSSTTKSVELPFGAGPKSNESTFGTTTKANDLPFGTTTKPTDSPFGITSKANEVQFGAVSKTSVVPFGAATKTNDSPFGTTTTKASVAPFGTTSKTSDSPFGVASKTIESPFGGGTTKPIESPFGGTKSIPPPFGSGGFLKPPTTSPFGSTLPTTSSSPFGPTNLAQSKSAFGSTETKPALFRNVSKPTENVFGSTETTMKKDTPFGSTSKPSEPSNVFASTAPSFNFAAKPLEAPSAGSAFFKFGEAKTESNPITNGFPAAPPAKVPQFGSFSTPEPKPFAFGGSTDTAPKPGGFSFGQTETKPQNPAGGVFSFGNAPAASAAPAGGGFNFASPPASSSGGFNFGGKVESSGAFGGGGTAFGAGQSGSGSFNFGSGGNVGADKAVFSFGAAATAPGQSQGGFGGQQQQPQGGFGFGAPQPLAVAAAPPVGPFNFTGAPPSFNFNDGNASQPQRKIKKALRRAHR